MRSLLIIIVLSIFCFPTKTNAQSFSKSHEFGIYAGGANYFGDLNTNYNFKGFRPAGGVFYKYNFSPYFSWKGEIGYGRLSFEDAFTNSAYQQLRNLSFFSDVYDINTRFEVNFRPYNEKDENGHFSPFFTAGIGMFNYNPKARINSNSYSLKPLGTEGQNQPDFTNRKPYNNTQLVIPFGIGFKQYLGKYVNLGLEFIYRKTFTDYIDDVSSSYVYDYILNYLVDPSSEQAIVNELADRSNEGIFEHNQQRGFSKTNDSYIFIALTLSYQINTTKCPKSFR